MEKQSYPVVLSYMQAEQLLRARDSSKESTQISPDLGLTNVQVELSDQGVRFPSGELLSWSDAELIGDSKRSGRLTGHCYTLVEGTPREISTYSHDFDRLYSLMPTQGAPTMIISGIPMHRIKGTDPYQDTLEKIRAAAPMTGRVLDTTTGLGYTAIQASRTASEVITIELDPAVIELCRQNRWSRELFDNPRITSLIGDSYEVIRDFKDGEFNRVIHDPPTFSLAGELYSREFYRQVYRVLRRGGRLFHYIGNPDTNLGARVTRGAVRRLREAGFNRVVQQPEAFGVLAFKQ